MAACDAPPWASVMVVAKAQAWHLQLLQRGPFHHTERHLLCPREHGRLWVWASGPPGAVPGGVSVCFACAVYAAATGGDHGVAVVLTVAELERLLMVCERSIHVEDEELKVLSSLVR